MPHIYLPRAPRAVPAVEKNCHVEKFVQMTDCVQFMVFCCSLQYFVTKSFFLRFKLFCRKISFGTIYALLRGENLAKNCDRGEKITNMRYELEALLLGPSRPPGHLEGPYWLLPSYFRHSGYCHLSCAYVCGF